MAIDCKDFGFREWEMQERTRGSDPVPIKNVPEAVHTLRMVREVFNQSVEAHYFFLLNQIRDDFGFHEATKITDIFTASEQSAFWGQAQQRLSIQQGQVSNYLATIGKLTKELFQIVRELRILDERLDLYTASEKAIEKQDSVNARKTSQSAEIVLRSYWVDLKDGGVKSPGSVYGLASTLGYTALPDLFFAAPPMKKGEVDSYVNSLRFNLKLKNVLKNKLQAFIVWKEHTHKELKNRHRFTLKFLRQHYNSIQMYINWVKPYLRNVRRLSQNFEKTISEDIIGAFEGSVTEIEVMFSRPLPGSFYQPIIVMNMVYRTSPRMEYHQEGYQHKGPVHVGRTEFTLRGYAWSDEERKNYLRMREEEVMDILGDIDVSLKESIEALGDDLRDYLKQAGEEFPEDIKEKEEKQVAAKKAMEGLKETAEPFLAIFGGFKEIFGPLLPSMKKRSKGEKSDWQKDKDRGAAIGAMEFVLYNAYKNFKKMYRMATW
jgi:hypothetical protein